MRIFGAAAALAALGVVFAFLPWRISDGPLRQEAERRIQAALDAPNASIGDMSFVLLPTPKLKVRAIGFATSDGMISGYAPKANVSLKLDPLLRGVAKPTGIALVGADLIVKLPVRSEPALQQAHAATAAIAARLAKADNLNGLNEVGVDGGRLTIQRDGMPSEVLDAFTLRASLPSPAKPLKLLVNGRHHGGDIRLSFTGGAPKALESGETEPLTFSLRTPGWNVEFLGIGSLRRDISIKGALTAATTAVAELPGFGALPMIGLTRVPPTSFRATIDTRSGGATFSDLTVIADKHRFDGVGAVRHDGQRWQINATLASAAVDLTPLIPEKRLFRLSDGGWSNKRFEIDSLFGANIDFRLSADTITLGPHKLTRAAIAVMTRANRIEATLGESVLAGGLAKMRLIATRGSDGLEVKSTANLERVDLSTLLTAGGLPKRATGAANLSLTLDTTGSSAAQFAANADGKANITIRSGEIHGIDLERLANRRGSRPEVLLAEALGGRTSFDSATLSARISRGLVGPVEGQMLSGQLVGSLSGSIDLPVGEHNLFGSVVRLPFEVGQIEPTPVIDFSVTGPLMEPRITPNIAALLKRS